MKVMRNTATYMCKRGKKFRCICNYYRSIPNFSVSAKPLIRLTKKFAKFELSKECQASFDFLKESLITVPVLAYQILANHIFPTQMLVIIALGNVYAKNRIHKMR